MPALTTQATLIFSPGTLMKKPAPKTKGQRMAEKARKLTNHASPEERQRLFDRAMSLIYSGKTAARAHRR